jgi:hypothetical protein
MVVVLVAACSGGGTKHTPDAAKDAPPDVAIDAPACTPATGAGTTHGSTITAAETWTAAASPHVIPTDLNIQAPVTIEACAVVQIAADATVTVGPTGAILAQGAPGQVVMIEKKDAGAWKVIRVLGGTLSFTHTVIAGGGAGSAVTDAEVAVLASAGSGASTIHTDDLDVENSATQGLYVAAGTGFDPSSQQLTVHGAAGYPLHIAGRLSGTIPSGTYTGNTHDELMITALGSQDSIQSAVTWHDRGVPYHVGSGTANPRLDVTATSGVATLTIDPGVTVTFEAGGSLRIDPITGTNPATGALIANGTAASPIVFTSAAATPAAGDWQGIWFGELVDPTSSIQFAHVQYAGGTSVSQSGSCVYPAQSIINDAAIRIMGGALPASQFITNTTVSDSARHGIDRGWASDTKTDFLATNTFVNVAGCQQTYPKDANNACPATVPCP